MVIFILWIGVVSDDIDAEAIVCESVPVVVNPILVAVSWVMKHVRREIRVSVVDPRVDYGHDRASTRANNGNMLPPALRDTSLLRPDKRKSFTERYMSNSKGSRTRRVPAQSLSRFDGLDKPIMQPYSVANGYRVREWQEISVSVSLSTDLDDPLAIPYFLWDEPMTIAELRERLRTASSEERTRLLAKIVREARDTDVWKFTSVREVLASWSEIAPRLGRRRSFWEFLIGRWREEGLLDE